jgi:hypothetical protein
MSIFNFLSGIFKPAAELIDNLHSSDEEMGNIEVKKRELLAKMAEVEAKVTTKVIELQTASMEANAKVAISEQVSGSTISKNWRPVASLAMVSILIAMGFDLVPYKPLMVQIAGGFLGIYGIGRSYEKKN